MDNNINNIKEYLKSINIEKDEKRYVNEFYRRLEYLDKLYKIATLQSKESLIGGQGNVNSKRVIIVSSYSLFNDIKTNLQKQLKRYKLNCWDIYITYVDKTKEYNYQNKMSLIANELNCIKPELVFYIGTSKEYNDFIVLIELEYKKYNIMLDYKTIWVDKDKLINDDTLYLEQVLSIINDNKNTCHH